MREKDDEKKKKTEKKGDRKKMTNLKYFRKIGLLYL